MAARFLIKIEHLSLVNILLEKTAVRELIQSELNKKNLKKELDTLINKRDRVLSDYTKLSEILSKEAASRNAAEFIYSSI